MPVVVLMNLAGGEGERKRERERERVLTYDRGSQAKEPKLGHEGDARTDSCDLARENPKGK